jgi:hypothetical protein
MVLGLLRFGAFLSRRRQVAQLLLDDREGQVDLFGGFRELSDDPEGAPQHLHTS